ncbi:MAG TPA: gamma-glutamyltransferase [Cytophagaceae bacterium]|jgi:gamma-glutamyltranspeptidase/glutathione hydrolase
MIIAKALAFQPIRIVAVLFISFFPNILSGQEQADPYHYKSVKSIQVKKAAVVSAHPLASNVGLQILKKGGNAVDAAIAVQLALAVVYPSAGNIGGGGFMVASLKNGQTLALDYRETAPTNASRDMYLDKSGNPQITLSLEGQLASGVPGSVAGLFESHKYAKLDFKTLIQPSIDLAQKGFAISEEQANDFNKLKKPLARINKVPISFVKESSWKAGDTLIQKDLASTLIAIRDRGMAGFYEGDVARKIVEEMKKGNGIISLEDLKNYKVKSRVAMSFNYKDYTIIAMPLPSSGGILLQQMLGMTAGYPIKEYGFHTLKSVHLMTEIERRAYADRAKFLGDADFVKVPVKKLTDKNYISEKMKDFRMDSAGNSSKTVAGPILESEETTHLSIIDEEGNAVAVTTTLNGSYGSRVVVTGAGFLLNNEMDDFSVKPGAPNLYGLVGAEANAIAPNKRMLSSMCPTIVLKGKKPHMVVGTPGGSTIPTSVYQTIVNVFEFGLSLSDAINKPKFHHQWLPDEIYVEEAFPGELRNQLQKIGHKVSERTQIGRTDAILIHGDGTMEAVGDSRGTDSAAGY